MAFLFGHCKIVQRIQVARPTPAQQAWPPRRWRSSVPECRQGQSTTSQGNMPRRPTITPCLAKDLVSTRDNASFTAWLTAKWLLGHPFANAIPTAVSLTYEATMDSKAFRSSCGRSNSARFTGVHHFVHPALLHTLTTRLPGDSNGYFACVTNFVP